MKSDEYIFDEIAAKLLLIDKTDLSILADIMLGLQQIESKKEVPQNIRQIASHASKLSEQIIMEQVPFESGCERLKDAVSKVCSNWRKSETNIDSFNECRFSNVIPSDLCDLVEKFISSQQSVLENLEAFSLELEHGASEARDNIRRLLHTMKGEYGVFNLQEYATLIHDTEEAFEKNTFSAENLLRLKDLIYKKLLQFTENRFPSISDAERLYVFAATASEGVESIGNASKTENNNEEEQILSGDPSLIGDFITESRDHITTAETMLLELETDLTNEEYINTIFRSCHTIKGVAGFLGLHDINSLAHSMENMLDCARKKELLLTASHIDLLLEAMDCLKEFITIIESCLYGKAYCTPESYHEIMSKLKKPLLEDSVTGQRCGNKKLGELLVENGTVSELDLISALERQQQGDNRKVGQILISENNVPVRDVANALAIQSGSKGNKTIEDTIRVPVSRLDQLIDTIGEAVIAQSMINADSTIRNSECLSLQTKLAEANLIMRQIQEMSMSLRMVSVKSTFQKMARLVRDLSKKSAKEIELMVEGEETEIDKSVVENIGDPLIHMIRNAIDHGIESGEERVALGKSSVSKLYLRAYHKAGSVYIEIEDDGKGLDREVILKKAVAKNLCKDDEKLTDQEVFQFIFLPGFSTAQQVTDISGRGVGMDVVKKNVEALRGSIDIQSHKGKGTLFTIRLPLTLAIIDGMIVKIGTTQYIIPTLSIIETIATEVETIETVLSKGEMIRVRGNLFPIIHLAQIFGVTGTIGTNAVALIVEDALGKRIGIVVDEIIGQQQVVIKSLGRGIGEIPGVSGGAIMSDGTVSLILDINGIVKQL